MTGRCCTGEGPSRPLARRWAGTAASILPGAVLVLLPKCPLCLAAWLTVVAGVGVSAAAAAHVRELIMVFWVATLAFAAARIIRRRAFRRSPFAGPPYGKLTSWTSGTLLPSVRFGREWRKVLSTTSMARASHSISARIHSRIPRTGLPIDC